MLPKISPTINLFSIFWIQAFSLENNNKFFYSIISLNSFLPNYDFMYNDSCITFSSLIRKQLSNIHEIRNILKKNRWNSQLKTKSALVGFSQFTPVQHGLLSKFLQIIQSMWNRSANMLFAQRCMFSRRFLKIWGKMEHEEASFSSFLILFKHNFYLFTPIQEKITYLKKKFHKRGNTYSRTYTTLPFLYL